MYITGFQFGRGFLVRLGIFVLITLAFPFFVASVIELSGARNVGGASGAVALVLGAYLKPLIYLLFVCSMFRISRNRARSMGISGWIGICILLLILGDISFGMTFGSFWAVGFSLGVMSVSVPGSLLAALIACATLSFLPEFEEPMEARTENLYVLWKGFLFVLLGFALVSILPSLWLLVFGLSGRGVISLLMKAVMYLKMVVLYPFLPLIGFAIVSALLVRESKRPRTGGTIGRPETINRPMFGKHAPK
jgi:hypothetical protein